MKSVVTVSIIMAVMPVVTNISSKVKAASFRMILLILSLFTMLVGNWKTLFLNLKISSKNVIIKTWEK
jgi:hypothetical protein